MILCGDTSYIGGRSVGSGGDASPGRVLDGRKGGRGGTRINTQQ